MCLSMSYYIILYLLISKENDKIYKSHGELFRGLMYAYFRHTDIKHYLLSHTSKHYKKKISL